jgi:15-cis-phytoene synthase
MSAATSTAFASFERKWLDAQPENGLVAAFLPAAQRQRTSAFGCLVHELTQTAFHVREPQVAATKLAWWRQELTDAAGGKARHPITLTLFADAPARESDPGLWPALADAALGQFDQPGASTLAIFLEQLEPYYAAVACAEAVLFCPGGANIESNAALWTITHLLRELTHLAYTEERLPLPLSLLARHGVTRSGLAEATPERAALMRDYLDELSVEISGALCVAARHSLTQRVRTRLDRELVAAARRAPDPLAYLATHAQAGRWRSLWVAWREARALARGA